MNTLKSISSGNKHEDKSDKFTHVYINSGRLEKANSVQKDDVQLYNKNSYGYK